MGTLFRRAFGALALGVIAGVGFAAPVAVASHQFSDVPTSSPYHGDIAWIKDHGIAGNGPKFEPKDPLTREQASRWFHKYAGLTTVHRNTKSFTSVTATLVTATCGDGEMAISGGGTSANANFFLTDVNISLNSATAQWESDNDKIVSGTAQAWVVCQPSVMS